MGVLENSRNINFDNLPLHPNEPAILLLGPLLNIARNVNNHTHTQSFTGYLRYLILDSYSMT